MSDGKGNSQRGAKFRNIALSVTVGLLTYFTVEFFKFAPVVINYLATIREVQIEQKKDFADFKKKVIEEQTSIKAIVTQNTSAITVITLQQEGLTASVNSNASAILDLTKAFAIRGHYKP